jgi:hypothetical protein
VGSAYGERGVEGFWVREGGVARGDACGDGGEGGHEEEREEREDGEGGHCCGLMWVWFGWCGIEKSDMWCVVVEERV